MEPLAIVLMIAAVIALLAWILRRQYRRRREEREINEWLRLPPISVAELRQRGRLA